MHLLLGAVALLAAGLQVQAFSCKDQNNNDVDWYVGYKMPRESDGSVSGIADGVAFYYMDGHMNDFAPSPNDLNSKNQAIAYTLQQYYDKKDDTSIFHVMYNDEEAVDKTELDLEMELNRTNRTKFATRVEFGHTKGVVVFDGTTGFWLVHSVPKFPPSDSYSYPSSGTIYAQSILCMSFKYSELSKIGTQLYYNHPDIYSSRLPTSMAAGNPDLAKLIGGGFKKGAPYSSTMTLTTKGGQSFVSFAKSGEFDQDLYDKLVAPGLRTGLKVETWRRGSEVPLDCSTKYVVLDAQEIKVGKTTEFKYTKDHSKVAISTSSGIPYICIGDINRMKSQYVRGGGTVCLKNPTVWGVYNKLVETTNSC